MWISKWREIEDKIDRFERQVESFLKGAEATGSDYYGLSNDVLIPTGKLIFDDIKAFDSQFGKQLPGRAAALLSDRLQKGFRVFRAPSGFPGLSGILTILTAIKNDFSPYLIETKSSQPAQQGEKSAVDSRKVFVVLGRNTDANSGLFDFLRALDLNPLEWDEAVAATGQGSPYMGEVLDAGFAQAQAFIIFMTGDDLAMLGEQFHKPSDDAFERELTPQSRPNVLFEAGMAMGRHPDRTIIVQMGKLRPFSDAIGRHVVSFQGAPKERVRLRDRLKTAGCAVKEHGQDWMDAGQQKFEAAIALSSPTKKHS